MEHLASGAERAPERTRGRANHLWAAFRKAGKLRRRPATITLYGRACDTLWQWSAHDYPGIGRGMVEVLNHRVKVATVRHWRTGRRRAPQWAYQLLLAALERRIAELQHAAALIKKEAGD